MDAETTDVKITFHSEGHHEMISNSGCLNCTKEHVCRIYAAFSDCASLVRPYTVKLTCRDYSHDQEWAS